MLTTCLFKDAVEYSCAFLDKEEDSAEVERKDVEEQQREIAEGTKEEGETEQSEAAKVVDMPSCESPTVTSGGNLSVGAQQDKSSADAHYFYQGSWFFSKLPT